MAGNQQIGCPCWGLALNCTLGLLHEDPGIERRIARYAFEDHVKFFLRVWGMPLSLMGMSQNLAMGPALDFPCVHGFCFRVSG